MPSTIATHPLFNTTWTVHRLSPLYHGQHSLTNPQTLLNHSQHLKDFLKGDSIRGIQIDSAYYDGAQIAKAGILLDCTWTKLGDEQDWDVQQGDGSQDGEEGSSQQFLGIHISLKYEKATYTGILLRDTVLPRTRPLPDEFTLYPVFLTRMPNSVRLACIEFLSMTFDTHISTLAIKDTMIIAALENYILVLTSEASFPTNSPLLKETLKDLQLTFSFPGTPGLKTLDVTISREDVARFLLAGQAVTSSKTPFLASISQYLETHTGLNIGHPDVKLTKISCGAFVFGGSTTQGSEGRIKMLTPSWGQDDQSRREVVRRANEGLIGSLVRWAKG